MATSQSGCGELETLHPVVTSPSLKKKRSLAGHPDPDAEVIALSPRSLLATNRFICEVCNKGFQRDQNLQLHRRGHNLPWTLKHKSNQQIRKKVYICPEITCIYHDPARALGDLTGIKKHFSRKHGEKKWKCDKCSKKYAVQSDWKAHQKICGTREYHCDCGILFSRRDSFITHRAFCDALAEDNVKGSVDTQDEPQPPSTSIDNNVGLDCPSIVAAIDSASSPVSQLTGDGNTLSDVSKSTTIPERKSDLMIQGDGTASSSKWPIRDIVTSTDGNASPSKWTCGGIGTTGDGNASSSKWTGGGIRANSDTDASPSKWSSGAIGSNNDGNASSSKWTSGGIGTNSDGSASSSKWTSGGIRANSDANASPSKWTSGAIGSNNDGNASSSKWISGGIATNSDGSASSSKWTSGGIRANSNVNASPSKWTSRAIGTNSDGNVASSKWTSVDIETTSKGHASPSKWTSQAIGTNSDGNASSSQWTSGTSDGHASPSKWSCADTLNKAPGLSLSLGTGHGPGPPSLVPERQVSSDSHHPFVMQIPKGLDTCGMPSFRTTECQSATAIVPSSTSGAMEKLASLFSSSVKSYSKHDFDNCNMPSMSNQTGVVYAPMSLSKPAGSSMSVSCMKSDFYGPGRASLHHSGSAPLSATALLQKAAQMGASSSSLFQKFGARGGESTSGGGQSQVPWSGLSSTFSGSSPAYSKIVQTGDLSSRQDYGTGYPTKLEKGNIPENRNNLPGECRFLSGLHGTGSPLGTVIHGINTMEPEQENTFISMGSVETGVLPRLSHGVPQRREHEEGRQMVDFLGVEGGIMQASGTGIDRMLPHKELGRMNSFTGRIEVGKNLS